MRKYVTRVSKISRLSCFEYNIFITGGFITWHYNEHPGVSKHRRLDCLLNRLFRLTPKNTSKSVLLDLCFRVTVPLWGNPPVTGGFASPKGSTWWKHFPRYWPFVRGIHRAPVSSPYKGQWRGALMFPLICAWINDWVNNREAGDLRRHCAHYDVNVINADTVSIWQETSLGIIRGWSFKTGIFLFH